MRPDRHWSRAAHVGQRAGQVPAPQLVFGAVGARRRGVAETRIVLPNTQAHAELLAESRRTIAASRIEAHRAGAVALQAVEHTDPMQSSAGQSAVALRGTHMVASRS